MLETEGTMKKTKTKSLLAARAEQAIMQQLPVEEKTLRRVSKLMEPKNLKRLGIAAVCGTATLSVLGSVSRLRIYRAAMAHELKKQLAPVNKKLEELEAQNEELRRQNEQLQKKLDK